MNITFKVDDYTCEMTNSADFYYTFLKHKEVGGSFCICFFTYYNGKTLTVESISNDIHSRIWARCSGAVRLEEEKCLKKLPIEEIAEKIHKYYHMQIFK